MSYVPDTLSTRYRRAANVQRAPTHAWGTLLKQYLIKLKRACSVHCRAWDVRQMRSKRIQRACNARGTYSKRISHTPGTRRASRKFLSMFKFFLSQTRTKRATILATSGDARRTYTKSTQRTRNAF